MLAETVIEPVPSLTTWVPWTVDTGRNYLAMVLQTSGAALFQQAQWVSVSASCCLIVNRLFASFSVIRQTHY